MERPSAPSWVPRPALRGRAWTIHDPCESPSPELSSRSSAPQCAARRPARSAPMLAGRALPDDPGEVPQHVFDEHAIRMAILEQVLKIPTFIRDLVPG